MSYGRTTVRVTYGPRNARRAMSRGGPTPSLRVMRQELDISPLPRSMHDLQDARRQVREDAGDVVLNGSNNIPGLRTLYQRGVRAPLGPPPVRPWQVEPPGRSFARTWRQYEQFQRLRAFAELERDPLERGLTAGVMARQLNYNAWLLGQVAGQCVRGLPPAETFEAAIISMDLARQIFGGRVPGAQVIQSAPRRTMSVRQAFEIYQERIRASFGARPIPEAVVIRRPQLQRVFDYLERNRPPMPR